MAGAKTKAQLESELFELRWQTRRLELTIEALRLHEKVYARFVAMEEERRAHRDDDLGPLDPEPEGEPVVTLTLTLSGARERVQGLDFLLRHIAQVSATGQHHRYSIMVDGDGAADICGTRGDVALEPDEAAMDWLFAEPRVPGRRLSWFQDPPCDGVEVFVD